MEEEWMRDRALLRDLLQKTPHASPQELAQATGRQVELGEKMAQAVARRRSPQSRAFVLSFAGTSCPLLPLGPACRNPHHGDASCAARASDPDLQAAQVRLPQSTRTIWKILRKNGCIMLKPPRKLRSTESREPLEEIQMDFKDVESISPEQSRHRETPTYC